MFIVKICNDKPHMSFNCISCSLMFTVACYDKCVIFSVSVFVLAWIHAEILYSEVV